LSGLFFAGPLAFLAVSAIQPQPVWAGSRVYVDNFHPIQSVTFYFGFLLVIGSVLIIAYIYYWSRTFKSLLALVFTTIACGLISFNYFTEATFVPALVRNYTPAPILFSAHLRLPTHFQFSGLLRCGDMGSWD
jgi:hypothetical protein